MMSLLPVTEALEHLDNSLLEVPENQSFAPGDMLNFYPFAELFN